ncbi:MAG: carbohydrate kinase family protein [bacterium]|nr:carbohydrate kinase family protein [bacterium]
MYALITIGDIKLDTFIVLDDASLQCSLEESHACKLCIEYGAKIPVKDFEPQIAGSAPNVAVALSRLKLKTAVYSIVGSDPTGMLAYAHLRKEGVRTTYVKTSRHGRSSYSVVISYKGDRTILGVLHPRTYRLPRLAATKWLYLSEMGEDFVSLYDDVAALHARTQVKIGFNPGAVQIRAGARKLKPLLKATAVLFVNREEGHQLLGKKHSLDTKHLLTALWKLGPDAVVVTDGSEGAYAFDGGDGWHLPAFPATVVESTGAGDGFAAGVLAGTMYGKPLAEALRWGAANAASVVGAVGPTPGLLTKTQMDRALKRHVHMTARVL